MSALDAVYALRFLLELALLAGAAALAWRALPWQWVSASLAVLIVVATWGTFLPPKAFVPLPGGAALALESALFIGVGAGVFLVGLRPWALAGVGLWAAHRTALALLEG